MGYTFTIGEAVIDRLGDETIRIGARGESHPEAPAFGEPTDGTNSRWPSYSAWDEFCREAGIHELFFGSGWNRDERRYMECPEGFHRETPLRNNHPGAELLTAADRDFVRGRLQQYREAHPRVEPGFSEEGAASMAPSTLARLIWLDYWINWAVENCVNPVIENS